MFTGLLLCLGLMAGSDEAASAPERAQYEAARKQAGRDAAAHVRLALWCEAHGLPVERVKHLSIAILVDPANGAARGLLGLVAFAGSWMQPDQVTKKVEQDAKLAAALAQYNAKREKTPKTADAQWQLGLWCEARGLTAEAYAHFATVVRLDPAREAAWKRLGCKRHNGRWMTDAQIAADKAEAAAQDQADKKWRPLLAKWQRWLASKDRRPDAEKALAALSDRRAVPAVWEALATGEARSQQIAVQVLGQIDAPAASRALAFLATFSSSGEVRRRATETLKQRDPREFAGLLVRLLRDPIKYEVRPVRGPGLPGALFVEGKQINVQRLYAPPGMPDWSRLWGFPFHYDIFGLPVVDLASTSHTSIGDVRQIVSLTPQQYASFRPIDSALAQAKQAFDSGFPQYFAGFLGDHPGARRVWWHNRSRFDQVVSFKVVESSDVTRTRTIGLPVGQIALEYQQSAIVAQQQLANDVAALDAYNTDVKKSNERVAGVLRDVTGEDLGENRESWKQWWTHALGYAYFAPAEAPRATLVQTVPLAFVPHPGLVALQSTVASPLSWKIHMESAVSCFGAGTLVRTLQGPRPIETIGIGDRVLTQNLSAGALEFEPVVVVHHNPPSPTFLIKLPGETITSSPFHRFWVAGKGWVMAHALKAGDTLRMLDGLAPIESVASGAVQPVFNLDVAQNHDFFAGVRGVLVHDNTLPELRLEPFDASPTLAAAAAPAR